MIRCKPKKSLWVQSEQDFEDKKQILKFANLQTNKEIKGVIHFAFLKVY